jgi:endonuclease/exonuclease/phosphatase family metal-dependent hydrolase
VQLTFASYNVHKAVGLDGRRDPERVIAVLREMHADVIALQEADRRFGERESVLPRAMLDDSPWRVAPVARRSRSLGWHGNALLVRRDIVIEHAEPLHLPMLEPRGAVMAELLVGEKPLRVVGMHLDLSGLWRRRQMRAILESIARRPQRMPTVLMGDTNEWRTVAGCLKELGSEFCLAPTGPSFHARHPVAQLDRIIVHKDLNIEAAGVHTSAVARRASDHLPIWARVTA